MITNFEILTENQHVLISQVILRVGTNGCENQILRPKISNPRISERPIWSIISIEKFIWVLIFLHISHFEQNFSIWTSNFQIFRENVFCAKSNPKHFRGILRSWINQDQCEKHKKTIKKWAILTYLNPATLESWIGGNTVKKDATSDAESIKS